MFRISSSLFLVGASLLLALPAEAITVVAQNGVSCRPAAGIVGFGGAFTQFGMHNVSANPLSVVCGGDIYAPAAMQDFRALVYDRNPDFDIVCTVEVVNSSGSTLYTQVAQSADSGSAHQLLIFPAPQVAGYPSMQCTIPPKFGSDLSHITSYLTWYH